MTNGLFYFFDVEPMAPEDETIFMIFVSCFLAGLAFELVFFSCHYLGMKSWL